MTGCAPVAMTGDGAHAGARLDLLGSAGHRVVPVAGSQRAPGTGTGWRPFPASADHWDGAVAAVLGMRRQ